MALKLISAAVLCRTPFVKIEASTKGIYSCDWSRAYKVLVTGGANKHVSLLNPFTGKRQACLSGHTATVSHVIVNDNEQQIISLSTDKVVKVWDIRTYKCLQTMADREVYRPDDVVTSMLYDRRREQLVTGYLHLKAWPLCKQETSGRQGHAATVTALAHNTLFRLLISADLVGTVCVWDPEHGRLQFRFDQAHGPGAGITALAFDSQGRRLLTGGTDGSVNAWNLHSGACLTRMTSTSCKSDITGIICTKGALTHYVVAAGWSRRLMYFEDSRLKHAPCSRKVPATKDAHNTDILAIALMEQSSNLVSASADGELKVWNVESGALRSTITFPGLEDRPIHQRAHEALVFLKGPRLRHLCAAAGADGHVRLYDIKSCTMALEFVAGVHPQLGLGSNASLGLFCVLDLAR
jgi:WD40 repeat protein